MTFRPLRSVRSAQEHMARPSFLDRTDERCRFWTRGKVAGVQKVCGKQAHEEIGGRWYCKRHAVKIREQQGNEPAAEPRIQEQP